MPAATAPAASRRVRARTDDEQRVRGLALVAGMVALMWLVEVVDLVAGDLDSAGIRPRDTEGLVGIFLSPFLHGGFGHLLGNTVPFLVLGAVIALSGLARVAAVARSSPSSAASGRG